MVRGKHAGQFSQTTWYWTFLQKTKNANYWMQYEGTPGGMLDAGDSSIRANGSGTELAATTNWSADISAHPEWAMFSASEYPRSLYLLHETADTKNDYYKYSTGGAGDMTIFAFGRRGVDALLTEVPARFRMGFVDSGVFAVVQAEINMKLATTDVHISPAAAAL